MPALTLYACAKINLGLEVLNKRSDGFHNIRSVFIGVGLADTLEFEVSAQPALHCEPSVTEKPEDNIVLKALHLYAKTFPHLKKTAKITVRKCIPTGAGLGGGSSNAAATLVGLSLLNGMNYDEALIQALMPLASELGSDVPFFLRPAVALVSGRGEIVEPLNLSIPWVFLLACPPIHISTAEAFSTVWIRGGQSQDNIVETLVKCLNSKAPEAFQFVNHFESTIFKKHPLLSQLKSVLIANDALYASLSGSGSTVFGLFTSVDKATVAQEALASQHADLETYICYPATGLHPYK